MKIAVAFSLFILNSAIVSAQFAEFSFDKKVQKSDAVKEGTNLTFTYSFENTGDVPLIITSHKVECSCTQVTYPTDPVHPGEKGTVTVTFDSKDKIGWQYRTILLYANTRKGQEKLEFQVKILN